MESRWKVGLSKLEHVVITSTWREVNTSTDALANYAVDLGLDVQETFVVFGLAVFLSAIFWLPPFLQYRHSRSDLDLDSLIRAYDVVASFKLRRPISVLKENIRQIELDIFDEIAVPDSTVVIIYLGPSAELNTSNVVFAVVPNSNYKEISKASLSLLKSSFLSLVLRQSFFRLTSSLFGEPFFFEVLKFKGGITVIPQQTAFLLQKQTLFHFELNFSIYQIQEAFDELKNQLKAGLNLTSYENIYVSFMNENGSTVAPPTTVNASVLLRIGNRPPSLRRLKQLARTITGPHARNLGLNHTVFGRVKQVQLSTAAQHSLDSGGSNGAGSPSPAPSPHPHHHRHHHHHHHHHRHHDVSLDPSPAPAPVKSYQQKPPFECRLLFFCKVKRHPHVFPAVTPAGPPQHPDIDKPPPTLGPASHIPASSPLPSVVFAHVHPPNKDARTSEASNTTPVQSPLPSSSAGLLNRWYALLPLLGLSYLTSTICCDKMTEKRTMLNFARVSVEVEAEKALPSVIKANIKEHEVEIGDDVEEQREVELDSKEEEEKEKHDTEDEEEEGESGSEDEDEDEDEEHVSEQEDDEFDDEEWGDTDNEEEEGELGSEEEHREDNFQVRSSEGMHDLNLKNKNGIVKL
ncbi:hydroxyproline-rich glycoprotein family protein [Thalictrum thalictroides]|uniref:Hydroxyproline-rich glycoprotein family protein n=1 Tax=Thalictrum thalictroides TaxID=46969 RepID=A0A7J6W0V8_THATH|nr:hydroxyproline-rich glycoprotein family protein [Thalictrum thalictroides]